jgi:hypothetical protein
MPVRKPFFNDAGILLEMPVTDTLRVTEPAGAGQPMIWEQGGASNYFVGQWVSCKLSFTGNSVTSYAANTLFAFPIRIRSSATFNQISSVVTTLAAGGLYRIGVYRDTGSVYPGALVTGTDTGSYSSAAVGNPIGAVTFTLTHTATSVFRSIPTNAIANTLGEIGSNFAANSSISGYSLAGFAFAALPTNFPALASFTVAVTPLVGLRVSSVP